MRIATYNIWNNDILFEERIEAICETIIKIDVDIVCLQEVRQEENRSLISIIADYAGFPFTVFREYPDCPDEGLAIISKIPFTSTSAIWETDVIMSNYCAIRADFNYKNEIIEVTNVHLNWRSEEIRKEQVNAVNSWLNCEYHNEKYQIMCGDFNDVPKSSVHDLLKIFGWQDIVELTNTKDERHFVTFDLQDNPYLKEDTRPKDKARFDWIMINSRYKDSQIKLESVNIFGNELTTSNIIASDHYGVYVDLNC
jgi:maltose 6'-phosphate phosphatase